MPALLERFDLDATELALVVLAIERAAALGSIHNDYVLKFEEMANLVRDNKWIADPEVKRTIVQNWDHLGQLVGAPSASDYQLQLDPLHPASKLLQSAEMVALHLHSVS